MDIFNNFIKVRNGDNDIIIDMKEVKAVRKAEGGYDRLIITFRDSHEIQLDATKEEVNNLMNIFWAWVVGF